MITLPDLLADAATQLDGASGTTHGDARRIGYATGVLTTLAVLMADDAEQLSLDLA